MDPLMKDMPVTAKDGWRGRIEKDYGDVVVCVADGHRPNDQLAGYRTFPRSTIAAAGGKAIVDDDAAREAEARARLERQWSRATIH